MSLGIDRGELFFDVANSGFYDVSVFDNANIADGTWHHVAVTVDGSGNSLYIDGTKISSGSLTYFDGNALVSSFFSSVSQTDSVQIGMRESNIGYEWDFNGLLDDVRGYNRALSSTDIAELLNNAPTISSDGGGATANINVAENSTAVTTVTSTDPDLDTPTYSISGGADAAKFNINSSTRQLTFIAAPDFENPIDIGGDNVYDVQVQADDGNGGTDTQDIAVTVTAVNEAPSFDTASFTEYTVTTTADGAEDVTAADLDGDGDIDLLSASQSDGTIAWYENDGSQNFTKYTINSSASVAHSVTTADVDGDGDLDVLSASGGDNTVAWYENDGSENFIQHEITTTADSPRSVVTASAGDHTIAWYENDGSENFTQRTITTTAGIAHNAIVADVDDDGDLDVLSASSFDDTIAWYENVSTTTLDGAPTFIEGGAVVVLDSDVNVSDAELDALNGGSGDYDGASLTLVRNGGANTEDVFSFNDGNGITLSGGNLIKNTQIIATFDTTTTAGELVITFTDANGEIPTSADADNILRQITYANSSDNPPASAQIDWTFDDGNTGSQGSGGALQAVGSTTVTITAVNDAPVAVGDSVNTPEDTALIIDPTANDTDAESDTLSIVEFTQPTNGTVVDNGDGTVTYTPDANYTGADSFDFKLDDNSGSLFQYLYSHGDINVANSVNVFINEDAHGTDPNVMRTVIRDTNDTLDNDALEFDISSIVGDSQWHTYTVTVGANGIEVFLDGVSMASDATRGTDGVNPTGGVYLGARENLAADRFYGGSLDSVQIYDNALDSTQVTNLSSGQTQTTVNITVDSVNDAPTFNIPSTPTFTPHTITTAANSARSVTTADVDGDMDVLSASNNDDKIAWYENDGAENFSAHLITNAILSPTSVTTADVDGDGDLDVLSASANDYKIAWYENDGAENFTAHTISTGANYAFLVTTADVDGDGDLDVLSASAFDNKIAWYESSSLVVTLDGAPTFIEGGAAVVLDSDVDVSDAELDALNGGSGDYDGASLTLVRNGGTNAEDVFSFNDDNGITLSSGDLIKNSQIIATFDTTTTPGELVITFTNANGETPTSTDVDNILRQIAYSNSSDTPPASTQIDWTFDDGNTGAQGGGGALTATGSTIVTITATNDAPVVVNLDGDIHNFTEGDGIVLIKQGGDAAVSDPDSNDYAGGSLTVEVDGGLQAAEDLFSIYGYRRNRTQWQQCYV